MAIVQYWTFTMATFPLYIGNCFPLCPNGWMRLDQSCYYLSTFTLDSDESDVHCKQKGGSLASIYTDDIQNFLTENGKNWTYWIGERLDGDYDIEKKAQCNAKALRILCTILSMICVALLVAFVVVTTSNCNSSCPRGWMRLDLSCYYLSTFTLDFEESDVHCKEKGSPLASIYTEDVQNFLSENGKGWTYWIGERLDRDYGPSPPGYWTWKLSAGNCVVLNSSEPAGSNWMRSNCNSKHFFICEMILNITANAMKPWSWF
ncbi:killer cell lectin-like receptor subfamily E member 1 [Stigmatopora argus]